MTENAWSHKVDRQTVDRPKIDVADEWGSPRCQLTNGCSRQDKMEPCPYHSNSAYPLWHLQPVKITEEQEFRPL